MKAKTTILILFLVMGSVIFPVAHAQSSASNNTALVDSKGAIIKQNPSSWISAVFFQSSDGAGASGAYQVIFNDTAPSASSCTATPKASGLTGMVEAVAAKPNQLIVSFRESGSSGGEVTPLPSTFTLSCLSSQ
mgnify:CR=1 FL=1